MAVFSHFSELPMELRLLIWEAALPQSPSVHFLSYPRRAHNVDGLRRNQWQCEISNVERTINVYKDPEIGEPNARTLTWGRYSSYLARVALLKTCQESRRICLAHGNPSTLVSVDPANDIICIQDLSSRLPWTGPPRLPLLPELCPMRIALERPPYFDCGLHFGYNGGEYTAECECARDWIGLAPRYWTGIALIKTLGFRIGSTDLKIIHLLDYAIKPKHVISPATRGTDGEGARRSFGSEQADSDSSAVKLPGHKSKHIGKFHGHGVTFYALSAKKGTVGWDIPRVAWDFLASVRAHLHRIYGYDVVFSLDEAEKGTNKICVQFLACVRA